MNNKRKFISPCKGYWKRAWIFKRYWRKTKGF
jgi:hypothetical protein